MDFEQLIGVLFTLYILGSMIAGVVRRGRPTPPGDGEGRGPARTGLPEVLDMDELERRLRDLAGGRVGRPDPTGPAQSPEPSVARTPTPSASPSASEPAVPSLPQGAPRPVPAATRSTFPEGDRWRGAVDDWESWEEGVWEPERSRTASEGYPSKAASLPPAVEAYMRKGNPWQAAFVVKELLGPPRALYPHRNHPRR